MRRLLKIVTSILVTLTLSMPLLECFDRWDRPGPANDTELPIFLIVLFIALVLVAAVAIAGRMMDRQKQQKATPIVYEYERSQFCSWRDVIIPPVLSPPLRI